jgi:signal transduction histidine kinase
MMGAILVRHIGCRPWFVPERDPERRVRVALMTLRIASASIDPMSPTALAFDRRSEHRVLLGVAGGFADQHGVDVVVVRAALVLLTLAGGLGLVLYVVGHVLASTPHGALAAAQPLDQRRNLAVGVMTIGAALVMRSTGLWLGDPAMVVATIVIGGVALLGAVRPNANDAATSAAETTLAAVVAGRHARTRVIAGAVLIAIGLVLLGGRASSGGVRVGVYATATTIVGLAALVGPWFARTAQEMAEQRRQKIRLDEREAMAAHLHDSVLQTLALIQRNAHDPRRTVTLARRQEAELRQWLYGNRDTTASTLSGALQLMVGEVEDLYDIRIEPVVVGDRPMTESCAALMAATREACVNAAKHSGVADVSVYVEVGAERVEAFVRDRGVGFDPESISGASGADRRGIARSIVARLERIGGQAVIESSPGQGTEVRLSVPLAAEAPA